MSCSLAAVGQAERRMRPVQNSEHHVSKLVKSSCDLTASVYM